MSTRWQSFLGTMVARMSRGSVPVDGMFWVDRQDGRAAAARNARDIRGGAVVSLARRFEERRCTS